MWTSEKGLELIRKFEGLKQNAYYCPAGKLTIGYGHTGTDVFVGQHITPEKAEELLRKDIEKFETVVNQCVEVEITQGMYDALVSFTFNLGIVNFKKSTLLRLLNRRDYRGAAEQFDRWIYVNNRVSNGLIKRRAAEKALFLS